MALSPTAVGICTVAVVLVGWLYTKRTRNKLPYPPGPPGLPVLGNLFDIPENPAWYKYLSWTEEYSKCRASLSVSRFI